MTDILDRLNTFDHGYAAAEAKFESENAELKQKLAAFAATKKSLWHTVDKANEQITEDEATIESLNLRVSRLVDAAQNYLDHSMPTRLTHEHCGSQSGLKDALSSESDSQWLREKQADVIEMAKQQFREYEKEFRTDELFISSVIDELEELQTELRNPSPAEES